jgi:hypothetical protein
VAECDGTTPKIDNSRRLACVQEIVAGKRNADLPADCPGTAAANP